MWDIVVLGTYLILSCVYLWAQVRADAGKVSHTALRVISRRGARHAPCSCTR